MPMFKVFAEWKSYDEFDVEADTLEEAMQIVEDNDNGEYGINDGEYIDGSFVVDKKMSKLFNKND